MKEDYQKDFNMTIDGLASILIQNPNTKHILKNDQMHNKTDMWVQTEVTTNHNLINKRNLKNILM